MSASSPHRVAVSRAFSARYAEIPPFHPDARYPEAPYDEVGAEPNPAYDAVRRTFLAAGWDVERYGTPEWNPLGAWIRPGMRVLLKPNLVKPTHPRDPEGWRYVMTHGSVIRAVADYVARALSGDGAIWLADAPQTDSSWAEIVSVLHLDALEHFYRSKGLAFELLDLRREEWTERDGVIVSRRALPEDPRGYVAFDLGTASEFHGHRGEGRYYGADYDTAEVNRRHHGATHEYLLSGSAVKCDVFVNLPKLKTHKKTGITASLKNLVGINGDKNWLPHHTEGDPGNGGDEFPAPTLGRAVERRAKHLLRAAARKVPVLGPALMVQAKKAGRAAFGDTEEVVRSGNWWGNDTTWRMCLDLNKLLLYGNPDGTMRSPVAENRKPYLSIVDGILGGEGRGPMNPDPVESRLILAGSDPLCVDSACAWFMGFDPGRMPLLYGGLRTRGWPVTALGDHRIEIASLEPGWAGDLAHLPPDARLKFKPHFGWEGRL